MSDKTHGICEFGCSGLGSFYYLLDISFWVSLPLFLFFPYFHVLFLCLSSFLPSLPFSLGNSVDTQLRLDLNSQYRPGWPCICALSASAFQMLESPTCTATISLGIPSCTQLPFQFIVPPMVCPDQVLHSMFSPCPEETFHDSQCAEDKGCGQPQWGVRSVDAWLNANSRWP